jgi:hypothetical protein
MINQYEINDQDIWTTWGMAFQKGTIDELLKFPERKEGYSYSWPDEDGTERDVAGAVFNSRELSISAVMVGDNAADFIAKLDAFRAYIIDAEYFFLDCIALNKRFKLLYKSMDNYRRIDDQSAQFTLTLIDDFPNEVFAIA